MNEVVEKGYFELLEDELVRCRFAGSKDAHFVAVLAKYRRKTLGGDGRAVVVGVVRVNDEKYFHGINSL